MGMKNLSKHYSLLLGLDEAWQVVDVELSLEHKQVHIHLNSTGKPAYCSECGEQRPLKDHAPERTWRHLDTMQFETILTARVPRTKCPNCGVKTCEIPWAEPHGRFTMMFEAFAIRVLQAAGTTEQARILLGLNWNSVQRIMDKAVERGLIDRDLEEVKHLGIDEKSFRRGHDYITVLTDIDQSRVLEVTQGRDEEAANGLWEIFSENQKENIEAVAIDMWQAFENSVVKNVPEADIVHDRFHLSKHLNEAVDKVRRQEHKALKKEGDETLSGSRYWWLRNPEKIDDETWDSFALLKEMELKTSRAWAIREQFRWFWEYRYAGSAKKFFDRWYQWASRCRLEPVKKAAKMIWKRLDNILTWFGHPISNGPAEGFNSRIQSIKSAARGFKNFNNYRTRILFFCGKLDLLPNQSH
jgi:transposase